MGSADGFGADLAHAPTLHLALSHQIGDGRRHFLGRHIRIGTVLVEQRQRVEPQPAERFLAIAANGRRTAVLTARSFPSDDLMAKFGRYVDTVPELRQGFPSQQLVTQRSVDDGRIEKRYPSIHRLVQQADALLLVRMLTTVIGHAHHAETESRNLACGLARSQYPTFRNMSGTTAATGNVARPSRSGRENLAPSCGHGPCRSRHGRDFQKTSSIHSLQISGTTTAGQSSQYLHLVVLQTKSHGPFLRIGHYTVLHEKAPHYFPRSGMIAIRDETHGLVII